VNTLLLSSLILFAEAGADAAKDVPPAQDYGMILFNILPFVAIGFLFYFMLIRPQRKEQSKRQEMLSNVKKNDRVVTIGGIYGVVMNVYREADEITLKVDESTNTKIRVTLSSIARVMGDEPAEEEKSK
jgi:preprotein translocase subunit YajC